MDEKIPKDIKATARKVATEIAGSVINNSDATFVCHSGFHEIARAILAERERGLSEVAALKAEVEREHSLNLPLVQELERLRAVEVERGRG